jgi:hypothetical protein
MAATTNTQKVLLPLLKMIKVIRKFGCLELPRGNAAIIRLLQPLNPGSVNQEFKR